MEPVPALLWRHLRVHQIFGANTSVGKTVFTTVLCRAAAKLYENEHVSFLKPVSTGPEDESDSLCTVLGPYRIAGHERVQKLTARRSKRAQFHHMNRYAPSVVNKTLVQYDMACSPHLAAQSSGKNIPSDHSLRASIYESASRSAALGPGWLFIETAGGVHSPGPAGTTQADLYAPLRVPVILVGDSKLGGISQTISAFESLKVRGYDVEAILMFEGEYQNHQYLKGYFNSNSGILIETIPEPPPKSENNSTEQEQMDAYYGLASSDDSISTILRALNRRGQERIDYLRNMSSNASKRIWYPFTQQKLLTPQRIAAIDSAHGDYFQTFNAQAASSPSQEAPMLQPAFDGSASWWTQGLGHANPQLTMAAGYASGRYGHVMFAEAIHEPALNLAETLLRGVSNPRLTRVFYSDNGSTGCEVATKMALRAARNRYGWTTEDKLGIIGLKGGYHGDTIGAMDCSEPGPFNEKVEWYEGKGFWFDYPTVQCYGGEWWVDTQESLQLHLGQGARFDTLQGVFDLGIRCKGDTFLAYKKYIYDVIERLTAEGRKFGALMLEPVILGAGGMVFVDPLFQKALIEVVRTQPHLFGKTDGSHQADSYDWTGLPVVFDEVFTGLYRLGRFSSSSFLQTHADISVHAKLLTGGLVPLCTTLASESIFEAFQSDDKTDALLHGHSYTAHPVGCQVAIESLKELQSMESRGAWDWAKENGWMDQKQTPAEASWMRRSSASASAAWETTQSAWSVWSKEFVDQVSLQTTKVTGVWALGSVLAISMRAEDGAGYTSQAAAKLQAHFRQGGGRWNAHTRVLGNVFYVMASQKTDKETIELLQELCLKGLDV